MQFDFGQNWKDFSERRLTRERVTQAREHFHELMEGVELRGRRFLDIGFGQGLSLLLACEAGAEGTGVDINPKCAEVLEFNRGRLGFERSAQVLVGSILDPALVTRLRGEPFEVVHSWGVLHHTGDMYRAIDNACTLVAPGGALVLALYNRHWSSPLWQVIKHFYCVSPQPVQKMLIRLLYPVIYAAKLLVTGRNPFKMKRGMDFFYNVVDWVGGYPYEYAGVGEISDYLRGRGFELEKSLPAGVPTGCNEFVFRRS